MSSDTPIPSIEQLRALAESGRQLVSVWVTIFRSHNGRLWAEEERLADGIENVADALVPLQKIDEPTIQRWSPDVWIALRELPGELERIASLLGLGSLIDAPRKREKFKQLRISKWKKT